MNPIYKHRNNTDQVIPIDDFSTSNHMGSTNQLKIIESFLIKI